MSLINTIRTAFRGIAANALRSVLTALGVMIGVASVITTLALGNGARASIDASFRFLGSDQIQINSKMEMSKGEFKAAGKELSYEDGLNMPAAAPLVDRVDMSVSTSTKVRSGRNVLDMAVTGTTADAFDKLAEGEGLQPVGWPDDKPLTRGDLISQGRFFTSAEVSCEYGCLRARLPDRPGFVRRAGPDQPDRVGRPPALHRRRRAGRVGNRWTPASASTASPTMPCSCPLARRSTTCLPNPP